MKRLQKLCGIGISVLGLVVLTGCAGGYAYYGDGGVAGAYYGGDDPAFYGGFWGGGWAHGHDFAHRGFVSRGAGGFHGGGAVHGGGHR